MKDLKIVLLNGEAKAPKREYASAGYELYSTIDTVIAPNRSTIIPTGIAMEIDPDYVGFVKPKSGLSIKHKLENGAGVIDADYRGEIKVHIYNNEQKPYFVIKGNKIAQMVFLPIGKPEVIIVDSLTELSTSNRGEKGFGSSGDK